MMGREREHVSRFNPRPALARRRLHDAERPWGRGMCDVCDSMNTTSLHIALATFLVFV